MTKVSKMTLQPDYQLPSKPAPDALEALQNFLSENQGKAIRLNAKNVSILSGHQIELLMSGYRRWQTDGHSFSLIDCPTDVMTRLSLVGVPAQLFTEGS